MDFFFNLHDHASPERLRSFFCLRWKKLRRTRYEYVNTVLKRDIVVSGGNILNQIRAAEFDKLDREDNIRKK